MTSTPSTQRAEDDHDESDDCWNCGGDGFVSLCWEEWACADPEFGCDDCRWPCEICNPPHPPEVVAMTETTSPGGGE